MRCREDDDDDEVGMMEIGDWRLEIGFIWDGFELWEIGLAFASTANVCCCMGYEP